MFDIFDITSRDGSLYIHTYIHTSTEEGLKSGRGSPNLCLNFFRNKHEN